MALSDLEKIYLNRNLVDQLRLSLADKDSSILPRDGVYYLMQAPHTQSTIGSIAAQPQPDQLLTGFPPPPNSMGLVFLVIPNDSGQIECSINGQFDLEYAYIPDYDDMVANLIQDGNGIRKTQDVIEAYKRYTIIFEEYQLRIDAQTNPSGVATCLKDTLQDRLDSLLDDLKKDPRVFLRTPQNQTPGTRIRSIDWDDSIIDQDSFNQAVINKLYETDSTVLPYQIVLECRYRRVPEFTTDNTEAYLIELHVVNQTTEELANQYRLYQHRIMDVRFSCRITQGKHTQMAFNLLPREYRHRENQYVNGYGQACALINPENNVVKTDSMPHFEQPWLETPSAKQVGMSMAPEFEAMSEDPLPILNDLTLAMEAYANDWNKYIQDMVAAQDPSAQTAINDHQTFHDEITRVKAGIEHLQTDQDLMRAFKLMNLTMARAITIQNKSFTCWRLFQISFILTQLGSIHERLLTVRPDELECETFADVLWFATGGGKTEAYMGLITTAMFYQRIKGESYGVIAWLRFPLRMLSVQQFQRLAYVLGQANEIKVEAGISGFPFTVGYFTGSGTPGAISSTAEYASRNYLPELSKSDKDLRKLQFINHCPHCGSEVRIGTELKNFRIKHICKNESCWSNINAPTGEFGEGLRGELGIYVSDEECYRYLPTVLVGTLDKAAVIAHNNNFDKFFGKVSHYCQDHGFIKSGNCSGAVYTNNGLHDVCPYNSLTSSIKTRSLSPMKDPGFSYLISDELHLLGESLGNFESHYESLITDLQQQNNGIAPKNLGATATIRDYENHIHHLYLRKARRFPVTGRTLLENFYTRVRYEDGEKLYRRLFIGLLPIAVGKASIVNVVADVNARYHRLLEKCLHLANEDPAGFAARFNIEATRVTDHHEHLQHFLQPSLIYAIKNADADKIMKRFEEDNHERTNHGSGELEYRRLDGHTPLADIQKAIEIIETDGNEEIHQLVATSVVSHGVDIERLNVEIFTGWPKTTSEYLQSSSRSGRTHPGIVIAGLAYYKLFEYSVYSRFCEFHKFMDRLIESVPINRFAPNVLQRTLPGLLQAVILNWARHQDWGQRINIYKAGSLMEALQQTDVENILRKRLNKCLCLDMARRLNVFSERMIDEFEADLNTQITQLINLFKHLPARYTSFSIHDVLDRQLGYGPLRSFRDIEQQVLIEADTHESKRVLAGLSR